MLTCEARIRVCDPAFLDENMRTIYRPVVTTKPRPESLCPFHRLYNEHEYMKQNNGKLAITSTQEEEEDCDSK